MSHSLVANKRTFHGDGVYVGRPSKWGNPFTHLPSNVRATQFYGVMRVATREESIELYREYLLGSPDLIADAKRELRGKTLICWCSPLPCHANVLAEVANS